MNIAYHTEPLLSMKEIVILRVFPTIFFVDLTESEYLVERSSFVSIKSKNIARFQTIKEINSSFSYGFLFPG